MWTRQKGSEGSVKCTSRRDAINICNAHGRVSILQLIILVRLERKHAITDVALVPLEREKLDGCAVWRRFSRKRFDHAERRVHAQALEPHNDELDPRQLAAELGDAGHEVAREQVADGFVRVGAEPVVGVDGDDDHHVAERGREIEHVGKRQVAPGRRRRRRRRLEAEHEARQAGRKLLDDGFFALERVAPRKDDGTRRNVWDCRVTARVEEEGVVETHHLRAHKGACKHEEVGTLSRRVHVDDLRLRKDREPATAPRYAEHALNVRADGGLAVSASDEGLALDAAFDSQVADEQEVNVRLDGARGAAELQERGLGCVHLGTVSRCLPGTVYHDSVHDAWKALVVDLGWWAGVGITTETHGGVKGEGDGWGPVGSSHIDDGEEKELRRT